MRRTLHIVLFIVAVLALIAVSRAATFDASKLVSTDTARHLVSYGGTTPCVTQAMTALSSAGVATCTSVDTSWLTGASALTRVDDTNVTLTLGGTPATALLRAASLTLGWTGTLAAARLNANVVQGVTNDTNVTGSIAAQNLTLGWTGTLGLSRGGTAANLSATGGSGQVLKQSSAGATITVGTVAASEIASGAALTRVDDTNVTLTLGGTPATALLAATSITAGWSGQLATTRGGTGLSAAVTGLLLGDGAGYAAYAGTSCTNQFPRSLNASGVATCASVANADLAGSIAASKLVGTDIATVGTITTGTWNSTVIGTTYGGTGGNTTATSGRYLKGNGTTWATSTGSASGTGACGANTWASTLNSDAAPTCTQPAAANLSDGTTGSGTVVLATTPTLTGSVLVNKADGTDYDPTTAAINFALQLNNATSGAANNVGLVMTSEANGEVYLTAVQNAGNTAADFSIATRTRGGWAEGLWVE
jgi:hypothetical protein